MRDLTKKNKAIFLDRDGVVNEMVYNPEFGIVDSPHNPKEFKFLNGVTEAIKLFKEMGFLVIIVSNQPAVAKGKMTLDLLSKIDKKMEKELSKEKAHFDAIYYCLHHPDSLQVKVKRYLKNCNCRKPKPGLLLKAAKDFNIDLAKSYLIGDGLVDIQAGKKAGCQTVFLGNLKAYWFEAMEKEKIKPDFFTKNLLEFAEKLKKSRHLTI